MKASKSNVRMGVNGDPKAIWEALKGFAHYAFNKSHSVAYSDIAYQTAWLWVHRRNDVLEYLLNDGTKENATAALQKCTELGFRLSFPDLEHMGDKRYRIEQKDGHCVLHMPTQIAQDVTYESYVQLICDTEYPVGKLVLAGFCDGLTKDRSGLLELIDAIPTKQKRIAVNMEPEGKRFVRMDDILDGFKACGGVTDYQKTGMDSWVVRVDRPRSKAITVNIRSFEDDMVRLECMKYDMKFFGSVRTGVLDERPYVEHEKIVQSLQRLRERLSERGMQDSQIYYKLKDYLEQYMAEYFKYPGRRQFHDLYVMVEDIKTFERSVKLFVRFDGVNDILYAGGQWYDLARRLKRNSMVKMSLEYSPYIKRKDLSFIYDFDIIKLEAVGN